MVKKGSGGEKFYVLNMSIVVSLCGKFCGVKMGIFVEEELRRRTRYLNEEKYQKTIGEIS